MITANMNYSLEDYLTDIEIKNYSKATIKNKKSIIESFERWLGDTYKVELEAVTSRMCKRYIKHMMDEEVKANTINTRIKTIRNFYKFCIKEKIIKENPFEEIELLKEEKVMIKPFSLEQIQKMIGYYYDNTFMDSRNRAILTCLFETGIRSQELAGITMQDLFDDAILIRGKGNKQRLVPISLYLKRELAKYKKEREKYLKKANMEDCPFLFVCTRTNGGNNKTNKPLGKMGHDALLNVVKRAGKACGVDVQLIVHSCRRSFAQIALGQTDLYTVSRLLGHNQLSTTERYIQTIEDKTVLERGRMASPLSSIKTR